MAAGLYEKYKISHSVDLPDLNPLSFILRKAELGFNLADVEWDYLDQHELLEAKSIIKSQEEQVASMQRSEIEANNYICQPNRKQ